VRAPFPSFLLLTIVAGFALAGAARAAETPREAAAAHYARGIDLANQGLYEAALEQFNNAYVKSPHFAVLYNIGQAQIALGRPLDAITALSKYLRDGAEQVPLSRREQVQAQINLLESRIAELTIAADTTGAVIRVDGREVGRAPLFQPIRLAAGPHTVTATLANGAEVTRSVVLGEAERQRLQIDLAAVAPKPAPPPAPSVVTEAPTLLSQAAPPEPPRPRGETMRRASYILAGAGVLAGGAALGVYLANRDTFADWQAGSERLQKLSQGTATYQMQATKNNELASSLTTANHTILGLSVAGGALVAAGATLFFVDRAERRRTGELSLALGGGSANVAWLCRW
jgi:tetratricopeptide (TPR) repeat protein